MVTGDATTLRQRLVAQHRTDVLHVLPHVAADHTTLIVTATPQHPTFFNSWSHTASLAASEAECEAEALAPAALRFDFSSSIGFLRVISCATFMNAAPSRKPSKYAHDYR